MNKKILIGSIIAVAILIGVSFTSVGGFQSVKPNVKASPLFTVRTNRAIDKESRDLTCDYIGKNKFTTIPFPTSNSRNALSQRIIDIISRMDDNRFDKFIDRAITILDEEKKLNDEQINAFIKTVNKLKDNPNLENYIASIEKDTNENDIPITEGYATWCEIPFCLLFFAYVAITVIIAAIAVWLDCVLGCTYTLFTVFPCKK